MSGAPELENFHQAVPTARRRDNHPFSGKLSAGLTCPKCDDARNVEWITGDGAGYDDVESFTPGLKLTVFIVIRDDQNQLGDDDLPGKVKLKVEPLPTSLSTQILPPCSSTDFLAKVKPSPVPSVLCA